MWSVILLVWGIEVKVDGEIGQGTYLIIMLIKIDTFSSDLR